MELEEDDTIFKCVSILQARAPATAVSASGGGGQSGGGGLRGHSLRQGLMGLRRSGGALRVGKGGAGVRAQLSSTLQAINSLIKFVLATCFALTSTVCSNVHVPSRVQKQCMIEDVRRMSGLGVSVTHHVISRQLTHPSTRAGTDEKVVRARARS